MLKGSIDEFILTFVTYNVIILGVVYIILGMVSAKKTKDARVAKYLQCLAQHEMSAIVDSGGCQSYNGLHG